MSTKRKKAGVTLVELMVTMLIVSLMMIVIGVVMLDSHRGWLDAYRKVHGQAAADAATAQVAFEKVVRKASRSKYVMNAPGDLTVYYFQDWLYSEYPDRYARFYISPGGNNFYMDQGTRDENGSEEKQTTIQLCSTLTDAEFRPTDGGIEMKLVLNDGRETTTALTTAILHNE